MEVIFRQSRRAKQRVRVTQLLAARCLKSDAPERYALCDEKLASCILVCNRRSITLSAFGFMLLILGRSFLFAMIGCLAGAYAAAFAGAAPAPEAASPSTAAFNPPEVIGPSHVCLPQQWYPRSAVRQGKQGAPVVFMEIGEDGAINHAAVGESSGTEVLDQAAFNCVTRFQYRAATVNGRPVPMLSFVEVSFCLDHSCRDSALSLGSKWRTSLTAWHRFDVACRGSEKLSLQKGANGSVVIQSTGSADVVILPEDVDSFRVVVAEAATMDASAPEISSCESGYVQTLTNLLAPQ